jgi:type I restriction enzyme M protein
MLTSTLKSQINNLRNVFRAGGIANPLTAIEQISFLIFMKRLDEIDQQHLMKAKRVASFHYTPVFTGSFALNGQSYNKEQLRRSSRIQLPAEEMFPFVRDVVFPFLKTLHTDEGFAGSMKDANFLIPKASMLVSAVTTIEHLHITEQNEDTTGDLYEYLLNELSSAGKTGAFRTPRHIIKMMVQLVAPTKHDKIADLTVGTAGFLINAYKYLLQTNTSENGILTDGEEVQYAADLLSEKDWKKLKTETLYGFDFDTTMVRVALMNSIMHGISQPHIKYQDTLGKQFSHQEEFDVILMNPPFKGSIDHGDIHPDFSL